MAEMRFTDSFNPILDSHYVSVASTLKSKLWTSGVVQGNSDLHGKLNGGRGNSFNTPFNNTIATKVPTATSDDPTDLLTHNKFSTGTYSARAYQRAIAFDSMDIANLIAGNDQNGHVKRGLAEMWVNANQATLINQLSGILADNDANDSDDMFHTTYNDVASPSAAEKINGVAINAAKHTMGDSRSGLGAIMMHSDARQVLEDAEPNAFVPASTSNIGFDTYHGLVIIEDDSCVTTAGSNSAEYQTYLVGVGAFQYADDESQIKEEWDRNPDAGFGSGLTQLYSRRRQILQPQGFSCLTAGTDATHNTTDAEFALAATWDRVVDRKLINLAYLKHNV